MGTIRILGGLYLGSRRAGFSRRKALELVGLAAEAKVGFDKTSKIRRRLRLPA